MYKTILLSIDLGDPSSWERAAPVAVGLAEKFDAKVHLLTVIPDFGMPVVANYFPERYVKDAMASAKVDLAKFAEENVPAGFLGDIHCGFGSIYKEIISMAGKIDCDAIVMASHRPEMSDYLLGPNAARVARHAKQSVFIVRN